MRWLNDNSRASLVEAVRQVAPSLADAPIAMSTRVAEEDPTWSTATAVVDERFVAKFAWSQPAAARLAHEIGVLTALAGSPYLPEVLACGTDPVLLITRRVTGASLFAVVDGIDRYVAGRQLAEFLAAMHRSAARVEAVVGALPSAEAGPQHPASTAQLGARLSQWLDSGHQRRLAHWYDWADATLSPPGSLVLVHADLHGDNQVWTGDRLEVVVDYENVSVAEPEYDLRTFPGTGPGLELLSATRHHYERLTGVRLAVDRILAWHLRNVLNDVLWRSEAGRPLPDHRTPAQWIHDLAGRFELAGIDPSRRS